MFNWNVAATSSTGQYVFVAPYGSTTFSFSSDFGVTWRSDSRVSSSNAAFLYCSGSGQYVIYVNWDDAVGYLPHLSTDFSSTFASVSSAYFLDAALSFSGQYMFISATTSQISRDYGATWTTTSAFRGFSVACSSSGQYVAATGFSDSCLIGGSNSCCFTGVSVSSDFGASFALRTTANGLPSDCANNGAKYDLFMSSDGRVLNLVNNEAVTRYISTDFGASFSAYTSSLATLMVRASESGQFMAGKSPQSVAIYDALYFSDDFGVTWYRTESSSSAWQFVVMDAYRARVYAAPLGGALSVYSNPAMLPTVVPTLIPSTSPTPITNTPTSSPTLLIAYTVSSYLQTTPSVVSGLTVSSLTDVSLSNIQFGGGSVDNTGATHSALGTCVYSSSTNSALYVTYIVSPELKMLLLSVTRSSVEGSVSVGISAAGYLSSFISASDGGFGIASLSVNKVIYSPSLTPISPPSASPIPSAAPSSLPTTSPSIAHSADMWSSLSLTQTWGGTAATSSSGQYVYITPYGATTFSFSSDFGVTWRSDSRVSSSNAAFLAWQFVVMDAYRARVYAAPSGGALTLPTTVLPSIAPSTVSPTMAPTESMWSVLTDSTQEWRNFASSSNGQYVYTSPGDSDNVDATFSVSRDYGATWRTNGGPTGICASYLSCSGSGQFVVFTQWNLGYTSYLSRDFGDTNGCFLSGTSCCLSGVLVSSDFGLTFVLKAASDGVPLACPSGGVYDFAVHVSSSGQYINVVNHLLLTRSLSSNFGVSFVSYRSSAVIQMTSASASGRLMIGKTVPSSDQVYFSDNFGVTWYKAASPINTNFDTVNYSYCSFTACGGAKLVISGVADCAGDQKQDQYIKLISSSSVNEVAENDDAGTSTCSQISYNVTGDSSQ
eukprot:gene24840-31228_t